MEKSKLEKLSEASLIRYYNFIYPIVIHIYRDCDDISEFFNSISYKTDVTKKIFTPIGGGRRVDIEYIWCLIKYNEGEKIEGENINRPEHKERIVDFVVEETQYVTNVYSTDISTYLDGDDFTKNYLWSLKEEDEIQPWDWTHVDSEVYDSEITEDDFRI
jgi:hypothetical protein